MNESEINEIFENAMKDPELFSTIDIDNLLESIENKKKRLLGRKNNDRNK